MEELRNMKQLRETIRKTHGEKDNKEARLIIIDGNAILHRAFHALPPLTAPDGTLTNAVWIYFYAHSSHV